MKVKSSIISQMQSLTVVPNAPEGFGSLLQFALATYLLAERNGLGYYHTPFTFEHYQQEEKTPEQWNSELNTAIIEKFIPRVSNQGTVMAVRPEKLPLEFTVRNQPEKLNDFFSAYWNRANHPSYFDNSVINVAIHARTFNSTDCDNSEFRELLAPGSISDNFILAMINQLQNIFSGAPSSPVPPRIEPETQGSEETKVPEFPRIKFHIYAKTSALVAHYANNPNVIMHCEGNLLDDLHHMIIADLLIMSKSSLSLVASYYRKNPSLIRESYGYATTPETLFVRNNLLTENQINVIQASLSNHNV